MTYILLGIAFLLALYALYAVSTKRIKHIDKVNKELISNVAHELKTPMTSILGFVETLQNGAIEKPDKARYFMDIIAQECNRLNEIIQSTLELSRLENLKEDINQTDFMFEELLDETLKLTSQLAGQNEVSVKSLAPANTVTKVHANKTRIKQILTNLFSNAIKYNKRGGRIEVDVKKSGKFLVFSIFNTGEDIEPAQIRRLFERFYRVDDGRTRKVGGTGLGLSIVKKIVELYGGRITPQSRDGQGITFTVYLPILV